MPVDVVECILCGNHIEPHETATVRGEPCAGVADFLQSGTRDERARLVHADCADPGDNATLTDFGTQ